MHEEFVCHLTAYGMSAGARVGVPLGTYRAPSLPLAVNWLRERAEWLSRMLDPGPDTPWLPPGTLVESAERAWAVPETVRAWSNDINGHLLLAEKLLAGDLVEVRWHDEATEYELLAESVDAARMRRVDVSTPQAAGHPDVDDDGTLALSVVRAEIAEAATLRFAAVEIEARSRGANSYFGLRVPAPATPEEPRPRPRAARLRERLGRRRG
ncbi:MULTISPECIES: hypothetical protein [Streptomyces]|uniref:Uncharacterized protein n=2 Tax=Streptomyces TaxID=1883 RepID=A0ABU2R852_9ACTN|nr:MULTISPECIES: hypothetical protein [unclassified Streptomyces]MDT0412883.1 hypothetical protein [Streptomyces sp. DSM 41979]MYQ60829.1 hypothetical protein [Streptomyces sp. SID4926]